MYGNSPEAKIQNDKHYRMRYLLLSLMLLLSCEKEEKYLEIYYMGQNVLTAMNIPCNMIRPHIYNMKDMKIYDERFVDDFASKYDELRDAKENESIDVRIKIFYHHGANTDTICMGEYFTIFVNGQQKEDSPELLKLVKDKIYKK